jgi:PST family polysaccharide transporter
VWAAPLIFLGVAGTKWLIVEGYQNIVMVRSVLGLVVNIILNFVLIPELGAEGAALALLATAGSMLIFELWEPRTRPLFFSKVRALNIFEVVRRGKRQFLVH